MRTLRHVNIEIRPYFFYSITSIKNFDLKKTDCVVSDIEYF